MENIILKFLTYIEAPTPLGKLYQLGTSVLLLNADFGFFMFYL